MQFQIKSRWDDTKVLFTADIDATPGTPFSIQLGLAVQKAVSTRANLARANLAGAYLAGAYLAGAYLAGAYLAGANLTGAYLAGANLADANLTDANLADANLADANLAGAYLAGAYLAGANLTGAKAYGYTFHRAPIQINDKYFISLWDGFLIIGCEKHLLTDWHKFTAKEIIAMDGKEAATWWKQWKPVLFAMAKATGRDKLPKQEKE